MVDCKLQSNVHNSIQLHILSRTLAFSDLTLNQSDRLQATFLHGVWNAACHHQLGKYPLTEEELITSTRITESPELQRNTEDLKKAVYGVKSSLESLSGCQPFGLGLLGHPSRAGQRRRTGEAFFFSSSFFSSSSFY